MRSQVLLFAELGSPQLVLFLTPALCPLWPILPAEWSPYLVSDCFAFSDDPSDLTLF
jgi:hypothetical protein